MRRYNLNIRHYINTTKMTPQQKKDILKDIAELKASVTMNRDNAVLIALDIAVKLKRIK